MKSGEQAQADEGIVAGEEGPQRTEARQDQVQVEGAQQVKNIGGGFNKEFHKLIDRKKRAARNSKVARKEGKKTAKQLPLQGIREGPKNLLTNYFVKLCADSDTSQKEEEAKESQEVADKGIAAEDRDKGYDDYNTALEYDRKQVEAKNIIVTKIGDAIAKEIVTPKSRKRKKHYRSFKGLCQN